MVSRRSVLSNSGIGGAGKGMHGGGNVRIDGWSAQAGLWCSRPGLVGASGLGEEILQIVLPHGGMGVRAMAKSFFGDWEEDKLAVFHASDFTFRDAEFGRVNEIVG